MTNKTVLIVDDEKLVRWSTRQKLESAGYSVLEASTAAEGLSLFHEYFPDLITLDVRLPDSNGLTLLLELKRISLGTPIIMITAYGAVDDAVKALQAGAYDYLEKPINFDRLLHSIKNALEASSLRSEVERSKKEQRDTYSLDRIIGKSKQLKAIKTLLDRVAASQARTILVQGESGTGKELVAKALHYRSHRGSRPFMIINCPAIPGQLLENELFGHERGAFTDAKTVKKGLLELAQGGTVFFDEISEMPLNLQSKLLRVLEDQSFRRIGGVKDISVDVRFICTSNRDLEEMAQEREFREDLFYRLSVIPIALPPLRERKEDIDPLVHHFIEEYNRDFRKRIQGLTPRAQTLLTNYDWPGNIRELKNVIERAMILQDEGLVDVDILPLRIAEFTGTGPGAAGGWPFRMPPEGLDLYHVERDFIRQALATTKGNQTQASNLLAITRDTLRYKMKKYGLGK